MYGLEWANLGLVHGLGQAKSSGFRLGVVKGVGFVKFRRNALLSESDRREFSPEFGKWPVATLLFEPNWGVATLLFEPNWGAVGLKWVSLGLVLGVGRAKCTLRRLGSGKPEASARPKLKNRGG